MPSLPRSLSIAAVLCAALVLSGCSAFGVDSLTGTGSRPASGTAGGGMGGSGMGGGAGEAEGGDGMVRGVVSSKDRASISAINDQADSQELVLQRVVAPDDGWIVVRSAEGSGTGVIASVQVPRGETRNIRIPVDKVQAENVFVSLHVDRGTMGKLEYSPAGPDRVNRDRLVYVDRRPVSEKVRIHDVGIEVPSTSASLWVEDQMLRGNQLKVLYARVPEPAWLTVHLVENGEPGRRVGLLELPAGEREDFTVTLDPVALTPELYVALQADRGLIGRYEYMYMKRFDAPDQPFEVGGADVAVTIRVR